MNEDPCAGPCNSRARKAWKDYEAALAVWKTADETYEAAIQAGADDAGDRPEHPAEPNIKVWYGDPVFCRRCASNIRTALAGLDHLAGLLAAQVDGMRGLPSMEKETTGKRGKASTAPSVDPGVDDLDEMFRFLTGAEDWWRQVNPSYGPRPYMGEAGEQPLHAGSHPRSRTLGWLGDHFTEILQHAGCGQFGLQVLLWERRLQDATKSRPELRHLAARCPRPHCGQRTLFRRDDGGAECRNPDCRAVMYGDEYEEVRDEDLKRGGKPAGEMKEAS
jgi:hypothetical protein